MNVQTRIAIVTGASAGIGKATALSLAKHGWRVIGLGRDPSRCATALTEIRTAAPNAQVDMIRADLSLMKEAVRAAREIAALTDRVDVLLNNAGGVNRQRVITAEGLEATFAGNHLGHFVLTTHLLPLLRAAAGRSNPGATRIINVSSSGHERSPGLDWSDLQKMQNFTPGGAYTNAKLANILFTRALAKRLASDGIVVHAMHPGVVDSNFASHADAEMQGHMATLKDIAVSPEAAADTLVWLATALAPGETTAGYYHHRAPLAPSTAAQDDVAAEILWTESEALVAKVTL
jgi:NAD(P)-dependent dehydrogenase (short-subunit alcohol dehydrogenase family)